MKIVKKYVCEVCSREYDTPEVAQWCENACRDICECDIKIKTSNNLEVVVGFSHNYWSEIENSFKPFYIEAEGQALTPKEIDELIGALEGIKQTYIKRKLGNDN